MESLVTKLSNPADIAIDDNLKEIVLERYAAGFTSTQVAVALGMTRAQFNTLREQNPSFDEVCEYGENVAQAFLEEIALRGANGEIRNFNNTMMQFLLKCQYPETYDSKKDDKQDGDSLLEKLTAGSLELVRKNE